MTSKNTCDFYLTCNSSATKALSHKGYKAVIRQCEISDFEHIYTIINLAAEKYKGVIPADRWKVPYMSREELQHEIASGVEFYGYEKEGILTGIMGIQPVQDVTLIRHSYVRPEAQDLGIGSKLLSFLYKKTTRPVLIGTWADADWAIRFYEKRGFKRVTPEEKNRLLKKYWSIPDRQVATSVVLADSKWFELTGDRVTHPE